MKEIIRFTKSFRQSRLKTLATVLTFIVYMVVPSCQKYDENPVPKDSSELTDLILTSKSQGISTPGDMLIYFGHKIYKRGSGEPIIITEDIVNPNFGCFDGNFILNIINGNDKRTRVSSAEIRIDGILIAGPSDFSKNVTFITKSLSGLTPESVLEIRLNSAPGSFLDLWIEGTNTVMKPIFAQIGPFCQNSSAPALPVSSINTPAINGAWDPATINTSSAGKTIYTFTPADGQCATSVTMEIVVTSSITPIFKQIGPILINSIAPDLPGTSDNGISGSWSPEIINTSLIGSYPFSFIPSSGQCATSVTMIIEVTNKGVVSDSEGNIYNTVLLGDQWWMSENLRSTKYLNGDLIGTTNPANLYISNQITPKYQWALNGDESNVATYGRYYTWYATTDSRGVCPIGWHIPTDSEWSALTNYLTNKGYGFEGSGSDIAKSMATTSGWVKDLTAGNIGNDQTNNNSSGFTAIPVGYRVSGGGFISVGSFTGWWSSTETNTTNAWFRGLFYNNSSVSKANTNKRDAGSIRCVKDN